MQVDLNLSLRERFRRSALFSSASASALQLERCISRKMPSASTHERRIFKPKEDFLVNFVTLFDLQERFQPRRAASAPENLLRRNLRGRYFPHWAIAITRSEFFQISCEDIFVDVFHIDRADFRASCMRKRHMPASAYF